MKICDEMNKTRSHMTKFFSYDSRYMQNTSNDE